jgi:hypothetical protein
MKRRQNSSQVKMLRNFKLSGQVVILDADSSWSSSRICIYIARQGKARQDEEALKVVNDT